MKIHLIWVIIIALTAGLLGDRFGQFLRIPQSGSLAGQTLTNLSRALDEQRMTKGHYPESLAGVVVNPPDKGDHSEEVLRHVIYRRTAEGYVAFVGFPGVAYIEPGKACAFEIVK